MRYLKLIGVFCIFFSLANCYSQGNQWVWMSGTSTNNNIGNFGTPLVTAPTNLPPSTYEGFEWTDTAGNFWVMGGGGSSIALGSSLWKYNPQTGSPTYNQWTWMMGTNTWAGPAVYGLQGVPSSANTPGARGVGVCSWVDKNGVFWLYGGQVNGPSPYLKDDLWKYDPNPGSVTFNQWTWVKGSTGTAQYNAQYGTKGFSSPANTPGARFETSATWTDTLGNLWLFGGVIDGPFYRANDLWKYDPAINEWTWMNGNSTYSEPGVYGVKGIASPANTPGARMCFTTWTDKKTNTLWMFGGEGFDKDSTLGNLNDLWKYDPNPGSPTFNQWTWVSGSDTINQKGVYGTYCDESPSKIPMGRYECRARWADDCGNLWLFGGAYKVTTGYRLNDLWRYNIKTGMWAWFSGDSTYNPVSVLGTMGMPAAGNKPGGRAGSNAWRNEDGLWLFAGWVGTSMARTNQLWKYIPEIPTAALTANQTTGCAPLTVSFTDNSIAGCNEMYAYKWNFGDPSSGAANSNSDTNATHIFNSPGTYTVMHIVVNCMGMKDTAYQTIIVNAPPALTTSNAATICTGNSVTLTANGTSNFIWLPVAGLSSSNGSSVIASPTTTTTYTVIGLNGGNCNDTLSVAVIVTPGAILNLTGNAVLCAGDSTTLSAVGAASYQWFPPTGLSSAVSATVTVNVPSSVTYTLIGYSPGGCNDTLVVPVIVNTIPFATTSPDDTICENSSVTVTASGGNSYLWNTGNTNAAFTITPPVTTIYSVTVSNGLCSDTADILITVLNSPAADAGNNSTIILGNSTSLSATGGVNYQWSPVNALSCDTCSNPMAAPSVTTTYYVTVTDEYGCTAIDSVIVMVDLQCGGYFIPNVFSPNNDGQNDIFYPFVKCAKQINFSVYNRWGEKLFETNTINHGWDGFAKGKEADSGIYIYNLVVLLDNGEQLVKTGNVTLIR